MAGPEPSGVHSHLLGDLRIRSHKLTDPLGISDTTSLACRFLRLEFGPTAACQHPPSQLTYMTVCLQFEQGLFLSFSKKIDRQKVGIIAVCWFHSCLHVWLSYVSLPSMVPKRLGSVLFSIPVSHLGISPPVSDKSLSSASSLAQRNISGVKKSAF